jgi:hypothetical protein
MVFNGDFEHHVIGYGSGFWYQFAFWYLDFGINN